MGLTHTPMVTIGSNCEPYGAGPRVSMEELREQAAEAGFRSNTERDSAILRLEKQVTRLEEQVKRLEERAERAERELARLRPYGTRVARCG